jgi:hypothetical protein
MKPSNSSKKRLKASLPVFLEGSLPFCMGNLMTKIHGNGIALFRFLAPFPHCPYWLISEGQWGENRMLRFLDSKTLIFFPSEEKDTRFQASLSSPLR